ncbi:tyrosine phosphatase [Colletotrichum tofieldiae]|uniref:Tyrosine phosphatase n=1 Tax=Colletotrichum tofieldiae TaxID=708197 RepID=A0A166R8J7_9PEZI|nr:tyrosine phosphatase [Colletotrichum tofieldiae]GKT66638.1 tyrosine phosphatase [Colletotrichum tofieldiae]GKT71705.1 tyrosine phosphatase [Colletotrichum tofieldiae]GKT95128.1 tyrosine phosphatase [Colletotrichum tofieldiae]
MTYANARAKAELPSPPFHTIPGLPNFRDAGGYPIDAQPGRILRPGVVFRSAEPSRLTDKGITCLQDLGITHVYDLRSTIELKRLAQAGASCDVREWPGAQRVFVPVFRDQDYGPEAIALRYRNYSSNGIEGFTKAYTDILRTASEPDHPNDPFRTILSHLATPKPPSPILVHCTAGKDRTGVICALILSLCGVSDEVVAHEYSLTDIGLQDRREEIVNHLLATEALKGNPEGARRMIGSPKESMLATLAKLREDYGSVEAYVQTRCRLSAEAIDQIRSNLTVEVSDGHQVVDWVSHSKYLL